MASKTSLSAAAASYARALLELANEQNQAEPVAQELADIRQLVETNPSFAAFLRDPGVSKAERARLLDQMFKGKLSPLVYNTLGVMTSHGRLGLLADVASAYQRLLDLQMGKIEVDVTVAQKLPASELENVRQRISQAFGKQAIVHQHEDPAIIGGLVLKVGDKLIDGSVKAQLELMKRKLLSAAR